MLPAANRLSIARYRARAASYDASARRTMPLRLRTIALLELVPGDVVLDVGAGTGLSFEPLLARVGPQGRVLAVEQSPEMLAQARARVERQGWGGVWLCEAAAETVRLPQAPTALLLNYVHDISRSDAAVDNLLRQAVPGARIAMAGMKFFPWWTGPLNLVAWLKNRPYNARPGELWRPWDKIESRCASFSRESTQWGMGFIARGRLREEGA
jgi:demethylmenaquinone methyltransferase/2-methoxy-6-polyprenyl-1,4-benzoquinol methylase